jgi:hypothetical protein
MTEVRVETRFDGTTVIENVGETRNWNVKAAVGKGLSGDPSGANAPLTVGSSGFSSAMTLTLCVHTNICRGL